jgi:hypothetical protein
LQQKITAHKKGTREHDAAYGVRQPLKPRLLPTETARRRFYPVSVKRPAEISFMATHRSIAVFDVGGSLLKLIKCDKPV